MTTEYGNRLRTARKFAGLTQVQLADKTHIPQSTISTAERLGNGSSETVTYAIACGVDPGWLATGQGPMLQSTAPLYTGSTNHAVAPVSQALAATESVARSPMAEAAAKFFDTLPDDYLVRAKALIQIEAIIAAAREPPTKRPMPESWQDTKKTA